MKNTLIWFTNDLRIHDNETLYRAMAQNSNLIAVYCFDERHFQKTSLGFDKTGNFRTQFLIETVENLRENLKKLAIDLVIRIGKPEIEIVELAKILQVDTVFASKEATFEELEVENKLANNLRAIACRLQMYWQATLWHIEDLPFSITTIPDVFTDFRKAGENMVKVRNTFPIPTKQKKSDLTNSFPNNNIDLGKIPNLQQFQKTAQTIDYRAVLQFKGGETAALAQLHSYFWEKDLLKNYKETRNGLIGADYSSKFSAWLAVGAISPRKIFEEIVAYEQQRTKNASTYWLFFELLWRDYFRFIALKYGNKLFLANGLKGDYKKLGLSNNKSLFESWIHGKTSQPFVNANMLELKQTGFMSNRGRQNIASYLVKDLKINWRWGAMYFESQLIDYDVCSNWGNWNYVAGVGNDPRENRYFNVAGQAKKYDEKGEFVRLWLGENQ